MVDVNTGDTWLTIGEVARRTGLPVKTIRYYADIGLVPPTDRSTSGYRYYDAAAVARLDFVRTLRELDIDLASVRAVVERAASLSDVAGAHASALDAQLRILRTRRSILRAVAKLGIDNEKELMVMSRLAQLSAAERQQIIDEYWDEVFAGLDVDPAFVDKSRSLRIELPDDPSPEQVEAWIELAELVQDPDYRARAREMAETAHEAHTSGQGTTSVPDQELFARVTAVVEPKRQAGAAPDSDQGAQAAGELVPAFAEARGASDSAEFRRQLADELMSFSDRRVERFWELVGIVNGWPPRPADAGGVATMEWFAAALRAHAPAG